MPSYSPLAAFGVAMQDMERTNKRLARLGLTQRIMEMNRYWSYYCCTQYDARNVGWDGRKLMSPMERDAVSHNAYLPPGFFDAGGQFDEIPLSCRRPLAAYNLVRVVVNRFTGLLFSARMHPKLKVKEPDQQSWLETLCKRSNMWVRFAHARTVGGGMGSVALSFRFKNGKPIIDVHEGMWCTPTIVDSATGELSALEIRYMYPLEQRDKEGVLRQIWYWYRRVIDAEKDIVWHAWPVGEGEKAGEEPPWDDMLERGEATVDNHGFGEVPAVWVRNTETTEVDGEPDCFGEFDTQDAIDVLISQGTQGATENADPSFMIASDEFKADAMKKGSRNGIKLEKGGSATYVEMNGGGVKSALEVAAQHRKNMLEVVQCILDSDETGGSMTATEVERRRESMHGRGDLFREQYGEMGVKPLIGKLVRAVIKLRTRQVQDPNTGLRIVAEVMPGVPMPKLLDKFDDDDLELSWPEWVQRGPTDAQAAAGAIAAARTAQIVDKETAIQYIAPFFGIEDPAAALQRLVEEAGAVDQGMMGDMQAAGGGGPAPPSGPEGSTPDPSAPVDAGPDGSPTQPPDGAPPQAGPEPIGDAATAAAPTPAPAEPPAIVERLNGAQIDALTKMLRSAMSGELPAETIEETILSLFPIPVDRVRRMMDPIKAVLQQRPAAPTVPAPVLAVPPQPVETK